MTSDCCIAYLVNDPVKGLLVHALKLLNLIKYSVIQQALQPWFPHL